MKAVKSQHFNNHVESGDALRRSTKLAPNKKSGKDRHQLYQSLEQEEEDEDLDDYYLRERESVLDYIDDGDEDDFDDEDLEDLEED